MSKKHYQKSMAILAAGLWLAGVCGAQTIGEHGFYENQTAVYATQDEDLGEYIVGDQGDNNRLVVSNQITVVTDRTVVGGDGGSYNSLLVTDGASFQPFGAGGAAWWFIIGSNSSHNALVVQNAGTIRIPYEPILGWSANAHSNSALVTGSGSVFTNRRFSVGYSGSYNTLEVRDGGVVESTGRSFIGRLADSSHNRATVADEGSLWDIQSEYLWIGGGSDAAYNELAVTNLAGVTVDGYLNLGHGSGASHNRILVGSTGRLEVASYLNVGLGWIAQSNKLTVTEGGRVTIAADWEIGSGTGASYNQALVSAGGSVSNAGLFYIGSGTGDGGNRLEVAGEASRVESVAEAGEGDREFRVGFSSPDNEVLVADGGQLFFHDVTGNNRLETYIGRNAAGQRNQLRVEGGGVVSNDYQGSVIRLGHVSGSDNNRVEVDGEGSQLYGSLRIGHSSTGNVVRVTGGGRLEGWGLDFNFIGVNAGSTGNRLEIDGEGSRVFLDGYLRLGHNSGADGNVVRVEDGGELWINRNAAGDRGLDLGNASIGNRLEIDGEGSHVVIQEEAPFFMGRNIGASNVLLVSNGGRLTAGSFMNIGAGAGSPYNRVLVSAGGSVSNMGYLFIGSGASDGGNRFEITGEGSRVESVAAPGEGMREFRLGYSSPDNEVLVTDGGQLFFHDVTGTNRLEAYIGRNAAGQRNLLRVENGGVVSNDFGYALIRLGHAEGSDNNRVEVDGEGSQLYGSLRIGHASTGNVVRVTGGGQVVGGTDSFVGTFGTAAGNRLEISGTNSRVALSGMRVGYYEGADGNQVRVEEGGELWIAGSRLDVGVSGSENRLDIDGPASRVVLEAGLFLGQGSASHSNVLRVTNGGRLEMQAASRLPNYGRHNRVRIESGSTVESTQVYVGFGGEAADNEVTLSGADTTWINSTSFLVNQGNLLRIADEASLDSASVDVRADAVLELDGGTLRVSDLLLVQDGGTLRGTGQVENTGAARISGTLAPGFSAGTIEFSGDLILQTSGLDESPADVRMEIGGVEATDHDRVLVGGTLVYGGNLRLALIDGFVPQEGDSFQLFAAGRYTSQFLTFDTSEAPLPAGLSWDFSNLNRDGTVRVLSGDAPATSIDILHDTMDTRVGYPAVIPPGDEYPSLEITSAFTGMLEGEIVNLDTGDVILVLTPRALTAGIPELVLFDGALPSEGRYRIQVRILAEDQVVFQDAYYFSVLDAGSLPADNSLWAHPGPDGHLVYHHDTRGNRLPDFSGVGFGGGAELPEAPVAVTLAPEAGDDTDRIQAAIDQVSALEPDVQGLRGAVLLEQGIYEIGGVLRIEAGGVVLRGSGSGDLENLWLDPADEYTLEELKDALAGREATILIATGEENRTLVRLAGTGGVVAQEETSSEIVDNYVPVGANSFAVDAPELFEAGDRIIVERRGNAAWISGIGMDAIPGDPEEIDQWNPFVLRSEHVIAAINGRQITIEGNLVNAIEQVWGGGRIYRYTDEGRIQNVGIERLRAIAYWKPNEDGVNDTRHADRFVEFANLRDGWMREVATEHFHIVAVSIHRSTLGVTVEDSSVLVAHRDYYSGPTYDASGRTFLETGVYVARYGFVLGGQHALVRRCHALYSRHAFMFNPGRNLGPNVFTECVGVGSLAHSEPHRYWSAGGLYDNVSDTIALMNRGPYGSGQGWAGANYVAWNTVGDLRCEQPPTAQNWAIGHVGAKEEGPFHQWNLDTFGYSFGYWESLGSHVQPQSLYQQQAADAGEPDEDLDTDGDGIPDWWEEKYFGGPTNADADATSDATGMTNLEKYIAGLEPFNDEATFRLAETVVENGQLVLRWASVEGRLYSIDQAEILDDETSFTPLSGAESLPATPPENEYTVVLDQEASPAAFYRIRVRLP